jgi:predicted  nucleic acid-binding Zn-ribbon protein
MILKEFNYYLKRGTTLEDIQGSVLKKVNRWCDPTTGCIAHIYDTVLLKHWIVASDNVVGLYKLDNNILLFNDFQMIYDRLDKVEEALPKDDVKKDITDRLDKVEENLSNNQNELNEKRDELSNQENLKEKLEQEISALDKKIEEAKARGEDTTELERQKAEKERELATVTQNITNLTKEITNLEQKINNLLSQKDDIEKELEEHKPKEMAEKEYVDKRDNYILGQLESLIPKDPNRDSKKEEIENTDNSISSKEEELANKEKEIEEQKELAKDLSEEIDRLKREIEAAKARGEGTADLRKELASKEKELANTNTNISNLEKERDEIKKELANLKGVKEELEKELDSIKPPEMVTIATNQTITGAKTFSNTTTFNGAITSKGANTFSGNNTFNTGQVTFNNKAPICSVAPAADTNLANKAYVDGVGNAKVALTGNQTVAGNKTLSGATTFSGAITSTGANTFSGANTFTGNTTFNKGQVTFNNKTPVCSVAPTADNHLTTKSYVDSVGNAAVKLTGNQAITGVKTFSSPPVSATNPTAANQVTNKAYVDKINTDLTQSINAKDAQNVKLTGNQKIAGVKTFSSPVVVPNGTANTHAVNLSQLNTKADKTTTYTKTEVNNLVNTKEDKNVAKSLVNALRVELSDKISSTKTEITNIVHESGVNVKNIVITPKDPPAPTREWGNWKDGGREGYSISTSLTTHATFQLYYGSTLLLSGHHGWKWYKNTWTCNNNNN